MPRLKGRYFKYESDNGKIVEHDLFEKFQESIIITFLNLEIPELKKQNDFLELIEFDPASKYPTIFIRIKDMHLLEDYEENLDKFKSYLELTQNEFKEKIELIIPESHEQPLVQKNENLLFVTYSKFTLSEEELKCAGPLHYISGLNGLEVVWSERPVALWQIVMRSFIDLISNPFAIQNLKKCQKCNNYFFPKYSNQHKFCDPKECGKKFHGSRKRPSRYSDELDNNEAYKKRTGKSYKRFQL
jgi:hypothetical protein